MPSVPTVHEQQFGLAPGELAYYAWVIVEGKEYKGRGRSKADALNQLMAIVPNGTVDFTKYYPTFCGDD